MLKTLILASLVLIPASYAQDSVVFEDLTCEISGDFNTLELKSGDENRVAVISNALRRGDFARDQINVECLYDESTVYCSDYLGVIEIALDLKEIKTRCGFRRKECLEIPGELNYRKRNALGVRSMRENDITCQLSSQIVE